jgi:hypothetical protein
VDVEERKETERPDRRLPRKRLLTLPKRDSRPPSVVAKPPPEAVDRVDSGGPWGPTPFDLPDPEGNQSSIVLAVIATVAVLAALVGFLTWYYFHIT